MRNYVLRSSFLSIPATYYVILVLSPLFVPANDLGSILKVINQGAVLGVIFGVGLPSYSLSLKYKLSGTNGWLLAGLFVNIVLFMCYPIFWGGDGKFAFFYAGFVLLSRFLWVNFLLEDHRFLAQLLHYLPTILKSSLLLSLILGISNDYMGSVFVGVMLALVLMANIEFDFKREKVFFPRFSVLNRYAFSSFLSLGGVPLVLFVTSYTLPSSEYSVLSMALIPHIAGSLIINHFVNLYEPDRFIASKSLALESSVTSKMLSKILILFQIGYLTTYMALCFYTESQFYSKDNIVLVLIIFIAVHFRAKSAVFGVAMTRPSMIRDKGIIQFLTSTLLAFGVLVSGTTLGVTSLVVSVSLYEIGLYYLYRRMVVNEGVI